MTNVGDDVGGRVGGNVGDKDDTKLTERQEGILNLITLIPQHYNLTLFISS